METIHSEQINEIMTALSKAQEEIGGASKDCTNSFFKTKYADLATVWGVIKEPLVKNGLAVAQLLTTEGDKPYLVTLLGHSSGQWLRSTMPLITEKLGPQEMGKCITYYRRYALASLTGVYQEDDDGESAQAVYRPAMDDNDPSQITAKQKGLLDSLLDQLDNESYEKAVCSKHKLNSIHNIPKHLFNELINDIKSKIQEAYAKAS